eukprot:10366328-Heterocapsa_arctica.AAC.1
MENNLGSTAGPWPYIKDNQLGLFNISSERASLHPPPGCWADIRGESLNRSMVNRRKSLLPPLQQEQ